MPAPRREPPSSLSPWASPRELARERLSSAVSAWVDVHVRAGGILVSTVSMASRTVELAVMKGTRVSESRARRTCNWATLSRRSNHAPRCAFLNTAPQPELRRPTPDCQKSACRPQARNMPLPAPYPFPSSSAQHPRVAPGPQHTSPRPRLPFPIPTLSCPCARLDGHHDPRQKRTGRE